MPKHIADIYRADELLSKDAVIEYEVEPALHGQLPRCTGTIHFLEPAETFDLRYNGNRPLNARIGMTRERMEFKVDHTEGKVAFIQILRLE